MKNTTREDLDKVVKQLKEDGLIPEETELIDQIASKDFNKYRAVAGTVKDIRILISPPVRFEMSEDPEYGEYEVGIFFHMGDMLIHLREGFMYKSGTGVKSNRAHSEEFNKAIAFFNIFGIPFDFVAYHDVTLSLETDSKQELNIIFSDRAMKRGTTVQTVLISTSDQTMISIGLSWLYRQIEDSGVLELGEIYLFLGYCNYYLFHDNYLFSFMNGWMFIEAMISYLWINKVKIPNKISKDQTTHIKTKDLFKFNIINKNLWDDIDRLRKKRNNVFHVDIDPEKRKVIRKDASDSFIVGWRLLNIVLGSDEDKILYLKDLREEFYKQSHKPTPT